MGRIVLVGRLWLERERIGPERAKEHAVRGRAVSGRVFPDVFAGMAERMRGDACVQGRLRGGVARGPD